MPLQTRHVSQLVLARPKGGRSWVPGRGYTIAVVVVVTSRSGAGSTFGVSVRNVVSHCNGDNQRTLGNLATREPILQSELLRLLLCAIGNHVGGCFGIRTTYPKTSSYVVLEQRPLLPRSFLRGFLLRRGFIILVSLLRVNIL